MNTNPVIKVKSIDLRDCGVSESELRKAMLVYCPCGNGGGYIIKSRSCGRGFVNAETLNRLIREATADLPPAHPTFWQHWAVIMRRVGWGLFVILGGLFGSVAAQIMLGFPMPKTLWAIAASTGGIWLFLALVAAAIVIHERRR